MLANNLFLTGPFRKKFLHDAVFFRAGFFVLMAIDKDAVGVFVGDTVLMTAAAAGGASLLMASPQVFFIVKMVGAVYLGWIGLQLLLRLWSRFHFQLPLHHWWLMGAGGLVIAALGPTSVWRSLTGRGWTWKGRSLA